MEVEKGETVPMVDGKGGDGAAVSEKEEGSAPATAKEVAGGATITLKSSDGKLFEVSAAAARLSSTVLGKKIDAGCTGDEADAIPLPSIGSGALEMVVKYCNKHAEAATMYDSETSAAAAVSSSSGVSPVAFEDLEKWDREFVSGLSQDALFDLIEAADVLDMDGLLDATCRNVADMMKGKDIDQIRQLFNIKDDFTQEEKKNMHRDYSWAFGR